MVPSSIDIVIQNRRISDSETSTIHVCDVVNIIALQHARVSGDQKVTSAGFYVIVRLPRHLDISQRMNDVVRSDTTSLFCFFLLPSRQIKRVVRLVSMNAVNSWGYFPD